MSAKHHATEKSFDLSWWLLAALLFSFILARLRAQALDACGPAPAVKAALDELPSDQSPAQTDWQFRAQRQSAIQALLKQYPNDLFVQRTHIGSAEGPEERDKLIEEYKLRHQQKPDDLSLAYLYGLALIGRDSPQAIELFDGALAKDPRFPWPDLALVTIYASPKFQNKGQAVSHAKAFLDSCPESLEGYRSLKGIDDKEMILQSAADLRALLQSRSDPDALGAYDTLWSLEFRAHPPSEYEPLRKQVSEDLKRLRALNLQDRRQWYEALEKGYKLVNDQKQSDSARDERQRRFPTAFELPAMSAWRKDHKFPASDAPPDKKREYYTELLKQSAEWVKERPNVYFFWWERADAMEHLEEVPLAEVESAVLKAFQVARSNAGPRELDADDYFSIAELLSNKGLQPERIVEMAQKGLAQLEIESRRPGSDLYASKENTENNKFWQANGRAQGLQFEADGYLRLKQAEKAQVVLAQMDEHLQDLKTLAGDKQDRKDQCLARESSYWGLMGHLAELQNKKLDAMAYYQNGLLKRLQARQKPETGAKDELAEKAHILWKSLGGTEEGWRVWYGRQADALAQQAALTWEEANLALPSFQLADLHGKVWQMADLKGKVTFLNFWASW